MERRDGINRLSAYKKKEEGRLRKTKMTSIRRASGV
jgi:hypothetical protein